MATLATFECDWIEALMMKSTFEEKKTSTRFIFRELYVHVHIEMSRYRLQTTSPRG